MADTDNLDAAISAMRADVPVRPEWRSSLEVAVHATPAPSRRGWHLSPRTAAAAALVCATLGALAGQVLRAPVARGSSPAEAGASMVGVRFAILARGVERVSVVGDFNRWDANAAPLSLERDGQTWSTVLALNEGAHAYAYVIDGTVVGDPAAPAAPAEDFGVRNSMILVAALR